MPVNNNSLFSFILLTAGALSAAVPCAGDALDVRAYGASGEGVQLDTQAIQAAVDACAAQGGGTVFFPAGAYLTGTIFLQSHVRLDLDAGARILGSTNVQDYPLQMNGFPSRTDRYCARALLRGEGLEGVAITGYGTIDGQGAQFRDNKASGEAYEALLSVYEGTGRYRPNEIFVNRPFLIQLVSCRDIRVENVHLRCSAMWMQHYLDCDFVTIRGVSVFNHGCRNNDMIDIDCCRNVVISDCIGDTDDDALTLKSTAQQPTEHVVISNCILRSHCNALKAGTESSGGFKDITITNCVIQRSEVDECRTGRREGLAGIALEIVDGGSLERVTISNIAIQDTSAPLFLRLGNRARPHRPGAPKPEVGVFRDVRISNVVATGAGVTGCAIAGLPGHPIENVSLSNIRIAFHGGAAAEDAVAEVPELEAQYPECVMFGTLPAYGFYCRHVDGLTLNNIDLSYAAADPRPALVTDDVKALRVDGFSAKAEPDARAQIRLSQTRDALITGCKAAASETFLKLEAGCAELSLIGNELSRARRPFVLDASLREATLHAVSNRLRGD